MVCLFPVLCKHSIPGSAPSDIALAVVMCLRCLLLLHAPGLGHEKHVLYWLHVSCQVQARGFTCLQHCGAEHIHHSTLQDMLRSLSPVSCARLLGVVPRPACIVRENVFEKHPLRYKTFPQHFSVDRKITVSLVGREAAMASSDSEV